MRGDIMVCVGGGWSVGEWGDDKRAGRRREAACRRASRPRTSLVLLRCVCFVTGRRVMGVGWGGALGGAWCGVARARGGVRMDGWRSTPSEEEKESGGIDGRRARGGGARETKDLHAAEMLELRDDHSTAEPLPIRFGHSTRSSGVHCAPLSSHRGRNRSNDQCAAVPFGRRPSPPPHPRGPPGVCWPRRAALSKTAKPSRDAAARAHAPPSGRRAARSPRASRAARGCAASCPPRGRPSSRRATGPVR